MFLRDKDKKIEEFKAIGHLQDAVEAAIPVPVSLVKPPKSPKPRPKLDAEFWCEISGTKKGWELLIKGKNTVKSLQYVGDWDNPYKLTYTPLKEMGIDAIQLEINDWYESTRQGGVYFRVEEENLEKIAQDFLTSYRVDYDRCNSETITVKEKHERQQLD